MKPIKMLLFIFLLSLGISETPETLLSSGQVKLQEGDLQGALTDFQLALEQDSKFDLAMLELAQLQLRLGNMDKARELLFKAVEVNEENRKEFERFNDINVKMNDGVRAMKNGQFEEAFSNYESVVTEFPNFTEAVYSMGLAKFRMSDLEPAVNYFRNALELNPEHEKARTAIDNVVKNTFNNGNDSYRRGNLEGAMELYHKVLTFDSTFTRAYYQIGVIETKRGNLSIALDAYSEAIEIDSTFYQGWFALGLAQNKYGNSSDALESFQQAVRIDSTYAKAYSSMGDIYIQEKNYEKAIEVLNTAKAVNPNYPKPYISLGTIYIELVSMAGTQQKLDLNKNIEVFSQLEAQAPENLMDPMFLLEMAKVNLEKGTSLDPKNSGAWVRLASVHNQLKDCESAKIAAREATDRKKRFGAGWYELGIAEWCYGKGNKTAALNALEKAREDRSWRQMAEYEIDKIKNPAKYEE
tara:strand:- start:2753 stop:4156 length:1404 start_codon:yes stop_codon:yes gene_type:complete